MRDKAQFTIYCMGGVLLLLFVPVVCVVVTISIQSGLLGDRYPLGGALLGGLLGVILMLILSVWLMVVASEGEGRKVRKFCMGVGVLNLLAVILTFLIVKAGTEVIYDRDTLALAELESPTVDVTGVWTGSWTDPSRDETTEITLSLSQSGNSVEGSIVDDHGMKWRIIEGVVSGAKINIFYDRAEGWPGAGATLLGEFKTEKVAGNYYAHDRPHAGWASKGLWSARRISAGQADEETGE